MNNSNCIIELKNVSKAFGDKTVVNDISLKVKKGEFVTLLGPSGCGKTTTLRIIAGFESATEGEILFNGKDISQIPPNERPVNTVFQRYALFPHLNVFDNVAFGLKLKRIETTETNKKGKTKVVKKKLDKKIIEEKVKRALKIVGLSDYEKRDVNSLSGGQQQRVAVARAIVNEPSVLLLDEPLAALDLKMRKEMQEELREMHDKLGITFIYVTHDQDEALSMSDTIIVMREGKIYQEGPPTYIYNEPQNIFVANFIGESNIFNGIMLEDKKVRFLDTDFDCVDSGFLPNEPVDVVIRPEDIHFTKDGQGMLNGTIVSSFFRGVHYQINIEANGYTFTAQNTVDKEIGSNFGIKIAPSNIQIMRKERFSNEVVATFKSNTELILEDSAVYEFDPISLFPSYRYDSETDELFDESNQLVDLKNKKANISIPFDAIELLDYETEAPLAGNIEMNVYKGRIYEASVITDSSARYTVYTTYTWDDFDRVGLKIDKDKFVFVSFVEE